MPIIQLTPLGTGPPVSVLNQRDDQCCRSPINRKAVTTNESKAGRKINRATLRCELERASDIGGLLLNPSSQIKLLAYPISQVKAANNSLCAGAALLARGLLG